MAISAQPDPGSGTIQGIVIDAQTREQLPSAHIVINPTHQGVFSTRSGSFIIDHLSPGMYSLSVSYLGYRTFLSDTIDLSEGELKFIQVELEKGFFQTSEIVVTATRKPQTLISTPVSLELVKAEDIRNKNIQSFDQIFDDMSGVQITRSGNANVQALSIRGASEVAGGGVGNRVMLLIDGRPVLSPDSGGALWNLVPVNSIEKIEVVKGAYSALFGSSAMGGVINVITRIPTGKPLTTLHLNYGFYERAPSFTQYDRYNDFSVLDFSHSNRIKNTSYVLDLSTRSNDGHREKSGFDLFNGFVKLTHRLNDEEQISFSGNVNKINNDTPATWISKTKAYSVAAYRQDDFQYRDEYNIDFNYSKWLGNHGKYTAKIYYYRNDQDWIFNGDPGNDTTNINIGTSQIVDEETIDTWRLGINQQLDFQLGSQHYALTGIDFHRDNVDALPDSLLYGHHSALNLGLYGQDEWSIIPNFRMTAGIRLDYYEIINEYNEVNLSPKLAFVYDPSEEITMRMLFAQAFRNPSIAERYIKFEQGGGLRFRPNPNLKSEKLIFSTELGGRAYLGSGTFLDMAIFYNQYRDLISYQQIPNPQNLLLYEVINLKKAVMQGVEVNFHYRRFGFFQLHVGYTFLDAQDRSENRINDQLAYKIKHSFHFTTTLATHVFSLNLNGRYKSDIREVFIYPGNEPEANFVFNANISYALTDRFRIYFSLKNMFDIQYEELERYRMPGRNYTLGMRMEL